MASLTDATSATAKPLEDVATIQSAVDALKATYQDQLPVDSAVRNGMPYPIIYRC